MAFWSGEICELRLAAPVADLQIAGPAPYLQSATLSVLAKGTNWGQVFVSKSEVTKVDSKFGPLSS